MLIADKGDASILTNYMISVIGKIKKTGRAVDDKRWTHFCARCPISLKSVIQSFSHFSPVS